MVCGQHALGSVSDRGLSPLCSGETMRMSNVMIGTRRGAGFAVVLLLLLLVAAVGAGAPMQVKDDLDAVAKISAEKVRLGYELAEKVHVVAQVSSTMLLLPDLEARKRELVKISQANAEYDRLWNALLLFAPSARERAFRDAVSIGHQLSAAVNTQIVALAMTAQTSEATALLLSTGIPVNAA